jgi:glycosyltransferase involved in cell wall biosynthesis
MIVFCHLLNDRSGSPTVLHSTLEALNAREEGLLFVGSQGRGVLEEAGVPTRRYWYRRSRHRIVTFFTYFASQVALYRALSRARDIPAETVVFVNTLLPFGAMFWARRKKLPVVVHVHEISITPAPLRYFLTRCATRCASLLLYVSHDHLARLPISGPPFRVLHNPVSSAIETRAVVDVRQERKKFTVLMLASLKAYKGVYEFISLAKELSPRTDIVFSLVLNADEEETGNFANQYAAMDNLTIHPRTDEPADFYETADLVVNLSRVDQWIETFGLTLAEAMTFGIPVIAPPVGGPAEIVTHGKNGFCIDSRDTATLAQTVVGLADDPETYSAMSRAARIRARDFSFSAYAAALQSIMADFQSGTAA